MLTVSTLSQVPSDGGDQAGLSLHPFVIGHRAMRIADPESGEIPQVGSIPCRRSRRD